MISVENNRNFKFLFPKVKPRNFSQNFFRCFHRIHMWHPFYNFTIRDGPSVFIVFKFIVNKVICTAEQVRLTQVGLIEVVDKPRFIPRKEQSDNIVHSLILPHSMRITFSERIFFLNLSKHFPSSLICAISIVVKTLTINRMGSILFVLERASERVNFQRYQKFWSLFG